jgi:maltose/moltooligosaccharide transporter
LAGNTPVEYPKSSESMKKPQLSFIQIWNMSFGFLGIQFGFALQNANVSRIFETLGADVQQIPILWIAAPVTGLIVQPIIGYLSDNTWNSLGRRRPFFLVGAILASIALIFMPNSPYLWIAAGMLWIMDASINVTMEPFRAFVGDMLPSEQRTKGFAMQSFFIGIGAVVASALPWVMTNWFNIANTAPEGVIPPSVKWSFYIGAAVFFLAVMWTVWRTKEYSPTELAAFERAEATEEKLQVLESVVDERPSGEVMATRKFRQLPITLFVGVALSYLIWHMGWDKELYILSGGFIIYAALIGIAGILQRGGSSNGYTIVFDDLFLMPKTMKQLSVVQFFSWFALFAMWIYTTAGVTSHIYDMKLSADDVAALTVQHQELSSRGPTTWTDRIPVIQSELDGYQAQFASGSTEVVTTMRVVNFFLDEQKGLSLPAAVTTRLEHISREYNTGADWVGIAFAMYNGFAALVAFLLPVIAGYTSRKITHAIALVLGAVGLVSIYFITDPLWILASMVGVGLAWASILAMPYAILAGALPAHKMGLYMGIFNFFIVLPQILAASILGFLVASLFSGQAIYALILGGASWIIAALFVLGVDDVDERKPV